MTCVSCQEGWLGEMEKRIPDKRSDMYEGLELHERMVILRVLKKARSLARQVGAMRS